jgi:hypothetical protein
LELAWQVNFAADKIGQSYKIRRGMPSQIIPTNAASTAATTSGQNPPAFMIPFFKLPLILYRLRMGWMLGRRFMLLTHIGRRSGKVYRSVLAVLQFDEKTREIKAISAWSSSNWYRNIQANPAISVETGSVRYVPMQPSSAGWSPVFPVGISIPLMRNSLSWRAHCGVWLFGRRKVNITISLKKLIYQTGSRLSFTRSRYV